MSLSSCGTRYLGGLCRDIGIALDPLWRTSSVLVLAVVIPATTRYRAACGNDLVAFGYWRSLIRVHGARLLGLLAVDTNFALLLCCLFFAGDPRS